MKKLINSVLFCLIYVVAVAQEAEQIDLGSYGTLIFRTNTKTIEYYESQIKLWEKKVKENKNDANAWYNYFAATKCAWQLEVSYQMEKVKNGVGVDMKDSRFKYAQIAEDAYKQIPNTFEGNYMMHYRNNFFVKANYDYLLKAQELKPFDKRIIIDVFRYYELIQDLSNAKITATEVVKQKILSEIDYATAYNMLMELDDNAVLITNGYNEYLSCLVLQKVKNIKPNVLITTHFNINPVNSPTYDYTDKTLSRLGLKSIRYPEENESNNKKFNWEKSIKENEEIERKNYELVFHSKYPVYVSNNCINHFRYNFGDKLYLHGLTYRYSRKPENFIYTMKDNFEKNYVLDYLKHDYLIDLDTNLDCQNFLIYLPMSATLQTFYKEHNQPLDEIKTKKFIRDVCVRCGIELAIETQDSPKNYPFIAAPIDFKNIEKSFAALNEVEHMGKYEVTNGEFKLFLDNLKQTKNYESYYKYYPDTMLWNKNFAQAFHDPMTNMYNYHPAYRNYPVVNITHEAAVAYCEWLTEQYNQQNPEGKHVTFRLPTEQEWRYAAGSKNEKAITPFPNDQILTNDPKSLGIKTDASSCYLGNIKFERKSVEEPQIIPKKDTLQPTDKKGVVDGVFISGKGKYSYHDDGGFHTVTVSSYYPNALGLYNTFGNVAEMTSTKGVIKGGSWDDVFDDCTFDKNSTLTAPDSRVGFRIIMEIMEDIQDLPTSKIAPNLGIDKKEITHFDWLEFLEYQKQYYGENSAEYRDNLPDTTLVKNGECEHYNSKLYNLPAYRDMPMIGITLKQAQNYSVWRTNRMFEFYLESNKYISRIENAPKGDFTVEKYYQNGLIDYKINTVEKYPYVPVFSIPSVEDYQQIKKLAIGNNTEKTKTKSMKMTFEVDSIALCNLNQINTFIVPEFKNIIYYLESGVAEWTSNENKVINGSVELNKQHKKGAVTDANQLKYIGFRNKVEWKRWEGKSYNGPFNFPSYNQKSNDSYKPLLMVKIAENFYCDQYELRIQDYARYVYWSKQIFGENSSEYKNSIPDTIDWSVNELKLLHGNYKGITPLEQQFTFLKGVSENQLKAYNQWKSNYMFYSFLYTQAKIKYIDFLKETKNNYFTINRYFNGDFDSLLIGEKVNMYPDLRIPTEQEKTLCQKYSDDLVSKGEFNFYEGKSIISKKYLNENYEFKCHETQLQPDKCAYLWTPKNKLFTPKTPFNIWENYRMIVEWKQWTPNQTK